MTFSIIGTGNTAWFLASRLHDAGHICTGVYGRDQNKATELATRINTSGYLLNNGIPDTADVCIIAVTDHAISEVTSALNFNTSAVIHTAGAISSEVLSKFKQGHGVVWPVYSLVKDNFPTNRDIPTVYEASNQLTESIIKSITSSYTDITHEATSEQRKWLHLSAVISNNFSNHLFTIAEQICTEHNLHLSLLLPIIHQTVSRIEEASPYGQQTGPARRNDEKVLKNHNEMLVSHPDWQRIYDIISKSIINMYKKA